VAYATSDVRYVPETVTQTAKILVTGAFGVGKTTLIGSVSEIRPLRTEEVMTRASQTVDNLAGLPDKTTTTVAMDFGRITVDEGLVLYVYGTPGQKRLWGHWDGLATGALGRLVIVDTRRLEASFEVLDQVEEHGRRLPLVVAVNTFPDSGHHSPEAVRAALDLPPGTPVITGCDARDRTSALTALITLVDHALHTTSEPPR
jgi:uncharacterized protein